MQKTQTFPTSSTSSSFADNEKEKKEHVSTDLVAQIVLAATRARDKIYDATSKGKTWRLYNEDITRNKPARAQVLPVYSKFPEFKKRLIAELKEALGSELFFKVVLDCVERRNVEYSLMVSVRPFYARGMDSGAPMPQLHYQYEEHEEVLQENSLVEKNDSKKAQAAQTKQLSVTHNRFAVIGLDE